jgi:hypothetical protein
MGCTCLLREAMRAFGGKPLQPKSLAKWPFSDAILHIGHRPFEYVYPSVHAHQIASRKPALYLWGTMETNLKQR